MTSLPFYSFISTIKVLQDLCAIHDKEFFVFPPERRWADKQ